MSADEVACWTASHADPNIAKCADLLFSLECTSSSLQRSDIVQDLVSHGVSPMTAKDLVACFLADFKSEALVLWDLENIAVPKNMDPSTAVAAIRNSLRSFGLTRSCIQVYGTRDILSKGDEKKRAELTASGCHVIDTPHDGKKETADKMLLTDAALWAADHPPPAKLVFLTSDSDMSYLMSLLRSRGYTVILVYSNTATQRLQNAASVCLHWERDVLNMMPPLNPGRSILCAPSPRPPSPSPMRLALDEDGGPGMQMARPPSPSNSPAPGQPRRRGSLRVQEKDDVLSLSGLEEEEAEARAAGIQELVQVLKEAMRRNPMKTDFATATIGDMLGKAYPLLKQQRYSNGWGPLWQAAAQAGLLEIETRLGPQGSKHTFLIPRQSKLAI